MFEISSMLEIYGLYSVSEKLNRRKIVLRLFLYL